MKTITVTKADYDKSVAAHGGDERDAYADNCGCGMYLAIKKRIPKANYISVSPIKFTIGLPSEYILHKYKFEEQFGFDDFKAIGITGKSFRTKLIPV